MKYLAFRQGSFPLCLFVCLWCLADLDHQFVECGVVTGCKRKEGIWPLKNSLLDRLGYSLGQKQKFSLISIQGVRKSVDQSIRRVVAEIQPLVLDSAQVCEADTDFFSQISEAPSFCVPKFPNLCSE